MARRMSNLRPGVLLLALGIAIFLWSMAHGATNVERGIDIPVEVTGLQDKYVVTDMSTDAINVRVLGSRAALRNLQPKDLFYTLDLSGAKRGEAEFEVDESRIELPRGARILAHSPSHVRVEVELKGRKAVAVRADIEGQPAEGFRLAGVQVEPARVWLTGARRQVLRLSEVVTEPIDVTGLNQSVEREARLFLGGGTVWREEKGPVKVRLDIAPDPEAQATGAGEESAPAPQEKG
jgi:YbbR domain-containing protein